MRVSWLPISIAFVCCLLAVDSVMAEPIKISETKLIGLGIFLGLLYLPLLVLLQRSQQKIKSAGQRFFDIQSQLEEVDRENTQLKKEINTDRLTRIGNRAHFEITYSIEWDRALRDKMKVAMLMVDIDGFKQINDQHGHIVGDDCLIAVALAIRGCLHRVSDRVMRYGGDEFAVLLGGTDLEGVRCVCDRILTAVQSIEFSQGFRLSVSIGGASIVPGRDQNGNSFIQSVDQALYRAKENGRNRFELLDSGKPFSEVLPARPASHPSPPSPP